MAFSAISSAWLLQTIVNKDSSFVIRCSGKQHNGPSHERHFQSADVIQQPAHEHPSKLFHVNIHGRLLRLAVRPWKMWQGRMLQSGHIRKYLHHLSGLYHACSTHATMDGARASSASTRSRLSVQMSQCVLVDERTMVGAESENDETNIHVLSLHRPANAAETVAKQTADSQLLFEEPGTLVIILCWSNATVSSIDALRV